MKKILSVLLATLMLLGVFAVGASAFELPTLEQAKQSPYNPFAEAELTAQAEAADPLPPDITDIMEESTKEALIRLMTEAIMASVLADIPAAYKDGKNPLELNARMLVVNATVASSQQMKDLNAFLGNPEAIKAAHANGTLKADLAKLYNAVIDLQASEMNKLINEFFTKDAIDYLNAYSELAKLLFTVELADLTTEQKAAIAAEMKALEEKYKNVDIDIKAGDFKAATKLIKSFTKDLRKILVKYGLVKDDSVVVKVWNFILRWIFFGWLWMK